METMSPKQQESINPSRCASLTGDPKMGPQLDKKVISRVANYANKQKFYVNLRKAVSTQMTTVA